MTYVLIDPHGIVRAGPRSGKFLRALLKNGAYPDGSRVKKISDEDALTLLQDSILESFKTVKKARKKAKAPEAKFKESDYSYRTGFFDNQDDLEELMKKLEVDKFVVQKDKKGYFALYNDEL